MGERRDSALGAWEQLVRASAELFREISAEVERATGVGPSEYDVLLQLSRAPNGRAKTTRLRQEVLLSQPALSRLLTRLEQRGSIARELDPTDNRAQIVVLTDQGRARWRQAGRLTAESVERMFDGRVTTEELATLEDILRRLRRAATPT